MIEERINLSNKDVDETDRYLIFSVDSQNYGINIRKVVEIIKMVPVTQIPDTPPWIKGIINLRGIVLPVMDMRLRLKKSPADYTDRTCIIIVKTDSVTIGLIVDYVFEVFKIPDTSISEKPKASADESGLLNGIAALGDQVYLLLDYESLC